MFFVYLNIQFISFHEHATPHEHVGLFKHNKFNLPSILGELQILFISSAVVQFFFKATLDIVRTSDNQWLWKFIDLPNEFWMSIQSLVYWAHRTK